MLVSFLKTLDKGSLGLIPTLTRSPNLGLGALASIGDIKQKSVNI